MPSPRSHFGNGTSYKLARQRGNIELDVQSSEKGHGRESLQSPIILLYSVVAIVIIYAIKHHDYTQYIYIYIYCMEEYFGGGNVGELGQSSVIHQTNTI